GANRTDEPALKWRTNVKQLVMFAAALLVLVAEPASAAQSTTPSFYDGNGGYAGSFVTQGNNTSFYSNGHFVGRAVRNNDGTTSFFEPSGHLTGNSPVQKRKRKIVGLGPLLKRIPVTFERSLHAGRSSCILVG